MADIKKKKRGFTEGYEKYDTSKGFGTPEQWRTAFKKRMSFEEAEIIVKDESPYEILGVDKNSNWEKIKKVFRAAAMKHHPDKNPGKEKEATERMQKIIAAYTILKKIFGL